MSTAYYSYPWTNPAGPYAFNGIQRGHYHIRNRRAIRKVMAMQTGTKLPHIGRHRIRERRAYRRQYGVGNGWYPLGGYVGHRGAHGIRSRKMYKYGGYGMGMGGFGMRRFGGGLLLVPLVGLAGLATVGIIAAKVIF